MPARELRCFILEETEADDIRDFLEQRSKIQVGRGVVSRISAKDKQRLDRTARDRGGKIGNRRHGRSVGQHAEQRRPDVSEGLVDRMDETLHGSRSLRSGNDHRTSRIGQKVVRAFRDPRFVDRGVGFWKRPEQRGQIAVAGFFTDHGAEAAEKLSGIRNLAAKPVIGHAAGCREVIFHDVKPVHRRALLVRISPCREACRIADAGLGRIQKIAVHRKNHVGPVKLRQQPDPIAEGRFRSLHRRFVTERLILRPEEPGEIPFELGPQPITRG